MVETIDEFQKSLKRNKGRLCHTRRRRLIVTRGLGADKSHERSADGGDGDREYDAQVVLGDAEVFPQLVAGPGGPVPVIKNKKNSCR